MSGPIYFDTETCGLHGPVVLVQWAEGDGPIHLHSVWHEPIVDTIKLYEKFANHPEGVIGFNLAFDWFHVCQQLTTLALFPDWDQIPNIEEYASYEPKARDGHCLKPVKACDVMLVARKGSYQSTMARDDVRIRRVPTSIAWQLCSELEERLKFKDIYFAKRKDKHSKRWKVYDITDDDGAMNVDFKDVVLKFNASSALKTLAADALGVNPDEILMFAEVEAPKSSRPKELGFAPFALAIGEPGRWREAWPAPNKIPVQISHWSYNKLARKYAEDDIVYTRELYKHFGSPELGDDDSTLACMVGAIRWHGYKIDIEGVKVLKKEALLKSKAAPKAPGVVRKYLHAVMDPTEILVMKKSTKKVILQEIAKWEDDEGIHPAAVRAKEVLDARTATKEVELYVKLLKAGRLHASFVVIGTLSSRMSGGDGLNAMGIKKEKKVRAMFPLAFIRYILCGGDFAGFEVVLADACYNDPDLRADLVSGKKIHALFGEFLYPGMTYDEIMATDGTADDKYTDAKRGVFALLYGGNEHTLMDRIGIDIEVAEKAYQGFVRKYKQVGRERQKIFDMFCSMRQPNGLGTRVEWHEPSDYIESLFGFRRYFTLENRVCKTLFELANKPPKTWRNVKVKVQRRDREQSASGAAQSALYGCAFMLQAANMRAAANHVIQSSGATITKMLQKRIWDLQPSGMNEWLVMPMNIHDEVMCPAKPDIIPEITKIKEQLIEDLKPKVPLIAIDWSEKLSTWADK